MKATRAVGVTTKVRGWDAVETIWELAEGDDVVVAAMHEDCRRVGCVERNATILPNVVKGEDVSNGLGTVVDREGQTGKADEISGVAGIKEAGLGLQLKHVRTVDDRPKELGVLEEAVGREGV